MFHRLLVTLGLLSCLALHYAGRLAHPSLYSDDIVRIAAIRNESIGHLMLRPFNEHLAPFFELVTWLVWYGCGASLNAAPLAFTVASYVPIVLSLGLLWIWMKHVWDSSFVAWSAVMLFGLSNVYAEVVYWFSASSFGWALFWSLGCWYCQERAGGSNRTGIWLLGSALTALLAASSSAIGLLAGPIGALLVWCGPVPLASIQGSAQQTRMGHWSRALAPLFGSLVYMGLYVMLGHGPVAASSLGSPGHPLRALDPITAAPVSALLPGLFGRRLDISSVPVWLRTAVAMILVLAIAARAVRRTFERRWLVLGMGLMFGGYALTMVPRSAERFGSPVFIQRYQLFPYLGLIVLLTPALRRLADLLASRSVCQRAALLGLGVLLLALNTPQRQARLWTYYFPDQPATLAAIDRLELICRNSGIRREQAMSALEPIHRRWFSAESFHLIGLLPRTVEPSAAIFPDRDVRTILLARLRAEDRQALWGGMDASAYVRAHSSSTRDVAIGRLVDRKGLRPLESGGYEAASASGYFEFRFSRVDGSRLSAENRALCLPIGERLELWWTDDPADWSPLRSLKWSWGGQAPGQIELSRLPHFDPSRARFLRVAIRRGGRLIADEPRLLATSAPTSPTERNNVVSSRPPERPRAR